MSDKIDLEYKGKHYYRIADLAKDYGISTSLVSSRWHSGHRSPADLVKKGALNTISPPHTIVYQNQMFDSAKDFCKQHKLPYQKVLRLMKKGIKDPAILIEQGSILKNPIQEMQKDAKKDEDAKTELINSENLFTIAQTSKITGIPAEQIRRQINHLRHGRAKDNSLNLHVDDIQEVKIPTLQERKSVKNYTYVAEFALKKQAIEHIQQRIKIISNLHLQRLPSPFDSFYFDRTDNSMWFYQFDKYLKCYKINLQNKKSGLVYELIVKSKGKERHVKFTLDEVKDMLKYPDITAKDILTRELISKKYNFPYSRNINSVLPTPHKRYSQESNSKVRGWSTQEVNLSAKKHPEKFLPLQKQFIRTKKRSNHDG
ncbi:MAG: hypothetical protein HDR41_00230 [Lactobacillus sp.]|nr:hypothetical protein [Lactobacillus sp.]